MFSVFRNLKNNTLWISWIFVGALSVLCGLLAIIQSRWIEQIGNAQRQRLQINLQSGLNRLANAFDAEIAASVTALTPSFSELESTSTEEACAKRYAEWRSSHEPLFRRIGVIAFKDGASELSLLDLATGRFSHTEWPPEWRTLLNSFDMRRNRVSPPAVLEFPLYGTLHGEHGNEEGRFPPFRPHPGGPPRGHEFEPEPPGEEGRPFPPQEDVLLLDFDTVYLCQKTFPDLISRYLEESDSSRYDAKVLSASNSSVIAETNAAVPFAKVDGSVALLDPAHLHTTRRRGRNEGGGPPPQFVSTGGQPRWRLLVRRHDSVDDSIAATRWRNFAVSGSILLLIVTMVTVLVHYSRRAHQLAQTQMNFVAGVSHDLRTPLTVIRTAAYNLRGRIATRPEQVEKYGQLIQTESEKLTLLVEQVLRYNAAKAGRVLGEKHPVAVGPIIDRSLESSLAVPAGQGVTVERQIDSGLPKIEADQLALQHAFQNLFDNAVKYGLEGSNWIGVSARPVSDAAKPFIEICVADRGPGIPAKEQRGIFEPFVRGERALQDHVQGTGLGLNLVKSIVEAHGGSVRLESEPMKGTAFIIRLPAAPEELQDEFANTVG